MSANVMFNLRKTSVDALSTISATAGALTSTVNSVAALAEAAQLHAENYRDETKVELATRRQKSTIIATAKAQHKVTRVLLELDDECKNPRFAEMLAKVQTEWDNPNPKLTLAAVKA